MHASRKPAPSRVGIIGAGRIGRVLALALQRAGHELVAASSRTAAGRDDAARQLGIELLADPTQVIRDADTVLICVPDDAVEQLVVMLASEPTAADRNRGYVLVSGSCSISSLDPLAMLDNLVVKIHPLQSVSLKSTPDDLRGVIAAITATTPEAGEHGHQLASDIGMQPFDLADEDRTIWHAAATLAGNYPVTLLAAARDLAVHAGLDAGQALGALGTLAKGALDNAIAETPERSLTGPVARADAGTIAAHLDAIARAAPHLLTAYRSLGLETARLAHTADRIDDAQHASLEQLLTDTDDRTADVVQTVRELAERVQPSRDAGRRIGYVPTMGALHEGHAALVRAARAECDLVVVSCYVNPLQFGAGEDLEAYPRTPEQDERIAAMAGADVLWRPSDVDVYGTADDRAAHAVTVGAVGDRLEGASRPGHFDGVATVVARLLETVQPDVLYLGEKDYQQVVVIRRLLRRLAIPIELRVVSTVREPDGLARSSRNAYLSVDDRRVARAIPRALDAASALVEGGISDGAAILASAREALTADPRIDVDYVALVDGDTLDPIDQLGDGSVLLVAARVGTTRLIDNLRLTPTRHTDTMEARR